MKAVILPVAAPIPASAVRPAIARRMRRSVLVLLLACALAACSGGTPKLTRLPADAVVLAFGDSLTFGTGAQTDQSYPAVLQRLISRPVINGGIPGETTAEGLARLPAALDQYHPALMLLCLGANDMLRGLDENSAAENLRAMVRLARGHGAQVVLIAVPRPSLLLRPPDFYRQIATEFRIPCIEDAMGKVLAKPSLRSDTIHPNAQGYRILAERIAAQLKKDGAL
jgi:lysophospholipase L1-like esterase